MAQKSPPNLKPLGCAARFPEKAKRGIATPKQDLDLIKNRLKIAEQIAKELTK